MSRFAPWQEERYQRAAAALDAGRLAHGLLFVGAAGLGKRAVADALAARLLCQSPEAGMACDRCRTCLLRLAGSHPDLRRISFELRDDGKPRTEIVVDQMRALAEKLSMTPQLGGPSVALIDPADAMNTSAANALLKTLEEPQPGRYLLLVSDRPARLPATIRSRCQRIEFGAPQRAQALRWLAGQGTDAADAAQALALADGNPGLAHTLLAEDGLRVRASVEADLAALANGGARAFELAREWLADAPDRRLHYAADAVRRIGWQAAGTLPPGAAAVPGLTAGTDFSKLASWFDSALRTRDLLRGPVRPELALGELLLAWRDAVR
jgi:DNA polymerase-3 subunit delta'